MAAGSSPGTDHPSRAWHWLVTEWNWPAAGLVVSGVLLALTPGFWWVAVHAGIVAWVALRRHQILSVRGGHVADPARLPGGDPRH
jgi:hypothetical protein